MNKSMDDRKKQQNHGNLSPFTVMVGDVAWPIAQARDAEHAAELAHAEAKAAKEAEKAQAEKAKKDEQ